MGKKVVTDVVKGVAITGAAVSGASIIGDANLVYAQEMEELATQEQVILPLETPASEAQVETVIESQAPAVSATDEDIVIYESTSASIETENSEILSTSESTSESQEIHSNSMSAEISAAEQQAASESAAYSEKGYDHEGLTEQEQVVNTQIKKVDARVAQIVNEETFVDVNGKTQIGNHKLETYSYYNEEYARGLAVEMVKYKLLLDGIIDGNNVDNVVATWGTTGAYEEKNVCVQYIDVNQVYHEEYYDYVTADEEGNSLFKWEQPEVTYKYFGDKKTKTVTRDDYADIVKGINVLKKAVAFDLTKVLSTGYTLAYTDADGQISTVSGTRYKATLVADAQGHKKGQDYYKEIEYKANIEERKQMAESISNLNQHASEVRGQLGEYVNSASESAQLWNLASLNRAESLSLSDEQSLSASEAKSESRAFSLSTSESEYASASASTSAAASEMAASQAETSASASATTTAAVASTVSAAVAPAAQPAGNINVVANNPQPAAGARIADADVPLAVVDTEEITVAPKETVVQHEVDTTQIAEEEVAKAGGEEEPVSKNMLWIILAIIVGALGMRKLEKHLREKAEK